MSGVELPYTKSLNKSEEGIHMADASSKKMLSDYLEIATQWHPVLNKELDINAITAKTHKKVWWKCAAGLIPRTISTIAVK